MSWCSKWIAFTSMVSRDIHHLTLVDQGYNWREYHQTVTYEEATIAYNKHWARVDDKKWIFYRSKAIGNKCYTGHFLSSKSCHPPDFSLLTLIHFFWLGQQQHFMRRSTWHRHFYSRLWTSLPWPGWWPGWGQRARWMVTLWSVDL